MCPYLFVHGTLRRGFDNPFARTLAERAEFSGPATVGGRIYAVTPNYPGFVLSDNPEDRVMGEVFRMRDPAGLLRLLDDYEGCGRLSPKPYEFERELTVAVLDRAGQVDVWTYVYRRPVDEDRLLISGASGVSPVSEW
ncbi:MAG: gamma-glutamylcyclotransferase [Acidobacteria bacterium]|nr:gamma-glutamylcyclotransferase [Acidobacteriota bacterium]